MRLGDVLHREIEWKRHGKRFLRIAIVIVAILYALEMGWVRPQNRYRGIAESKSTGLGAITEYPEYQREGYFYAASFAQPTPTDQDKEEPMDRKMVRSATLNLTVSHPAEAAARAEKIAEQFGGFVVKAELGGNGDEQAASLQVRVPAASYEEVRKSLRALALTVGSEESIADDVTRQYVDSSATLRSYRAEEAQYLTILKRANTVKDVLEVTEKLNGVRREMEKTEAEYRSLSQQVQMCLFSIYMHREVRFSVFSIEWRPWNEIRFATRSGLESLAAYVNAIITFAFHLPSILLWVFTVLAGAAVGWRALQWGLRIVFGSGAHA